MVLGDWIRSLDEWHRTVGEWSLVLGATLECRDVFYFLSNQAIGKGAFRGSSRLIAAVRLRLKSLDEFKDK